jgi:hemerythrin-like domain-containing protein
MKRGGVRDESMSGGRRALLAAPAVVLVAGARAAMAAPPNGGKTGPAGPKAGKAEAQVTPGEDLMQEHGILERILLVYDEAIARIEGRQEVPAGTVADAARIVRRFIEAYHEKLEEEFVFPRLERVPAQAGLVAVLLRQHQAGRRVTDQILAVASRGGALSNGDRETLAELLRSFARMYRPHAAREDTVLFPAFRGTFDARSYAEMGERFEEREHALFGEGGFKGVVGEVASIERALRIHDLDRFTPA